MPGEVYALICTFLWALSSAMLKAQTDTVGIFQLGALRTLPAVLIYWGLLLFTGRLSSVARPPRYDVGLLDRLCVRRPGRRGSDLYEEPAAHWPLAGYAAVDHLSLFYHAAGERLSR